MNDTFSRLKMSLLALYGLVCSWHGQLAQQLAYLVQMKPKHVFLVIKKTDKHETIRCIRFKTQICCLGENTLS